MANELSIPIIRISNNLEELMKLQGKDMKDLLSMSVNDLLKAMLQKDPKERENKKYFNSFYYLYHLIFIIMIYTEIYIRVSTKIKEFNYC